MYDFDVSEKFQNILEKLSRKDKLSHKRVIKKIEEIVNSYNVENYKNLRNDLSNFKRVQIGEKVLIFKFDKKENKILFEDFAHHDKIYLKKF